MTRTPRRTLAALAAAGLLATAACGGGDDSTSGTGAQASTSGDELVVYSGRNENLVGPLLEQFTEATGVEVTARYGGSAELAAQLLEEDDRTPADVFLSQDAGALGALQEVDGLAALPAASLSKVPARYRSKDGHWVGVSGRSRVLIYNPDLVSEGELPRTVFDLTGPQYKGKVAYAPTNASFQSFVTGMRVSVGEQRTRAFLEGLKANDPKAYEGNSPIVDAVDEGEIPFGLVNHYYLYEKAAEAGGMDEVTARNHLFAPGDPGNLVNVAGVGILEGKQSADAQTFVDFLLGKQAQTYFAEQTKEFPLIEGVPAEVPGMPSLEALQGPQVDLSELESLDETLALLDEVGLT